MKCQNETVTVELKNGKQTLSNLLVQWCSSRCLATDVLLSGAFYPKLRKRAGFHSKGFMLLL
jgi:hypothetical protein